LIEFSDELEQLEAVRAKMDEKVLFAPKLSQIWPLPALSH
jgi:hypothetical protein